MHASDEQTELRQQYHVLRYMQSHGKNKQKIITNAKMTKATEVSDSI